MLDCQEPRELAHFYSALLGQPVTYDSADVVVVSTDATSSGLAFQRAPGHPAPTWPDPEVPQQIHLDVMVASVGVFADPAGHPFCLIPRPGWAARGGTLF
jgi:hypothetical protein